MDHSRPIFVYFRLFYKQLTEIGKFSIKVPMTRFESGSSGIGSDRAVNCATTVSLFPELSHLVIRLPYYCPVVTLYDQPTRVVWPGYFSSAASNELHGFHCTYLALSKILPNQVSHFAKQILRIASQCLLRYDKMVNLHLFACLLHFQRFRIDKMLFTFT